MTTILKVIFCFAALIAPCLVDAQSQAGCPEPPNKLTISVVPTVTQNQATGLFKYEYRVSNAANSAQEVDMFAVEFKAPVSAVKKPSGWTGRAIKKSPVVTWHAVAVDDPLGTGGANVPASTVQIKAGGSLTGFSFESAFPPGPVKFYATGYVNVPSQSSEEAAETLAECESLGKMLDVALIGMTQGPVDKPVPSGEAVLLLLDSDSISKGTPPNNLSDADINLSSADIGHRAPLAFFADNVGNEISLHTGQIGDEGWFALTSVPDAWRTAGPTEDGLRNFIQAGPGLGTPDANGNRESRLDKVADVVALRATGIKELMGKRVYAVVFQDDISINYAPGTASLKGKNLGVVAFEVVGVTQLAGYSSSSLPEVRVRILNAADVAGGTVQPFSSAPEPKSSSEPFDVN